MKLGGRTSVAAVSLLSILSLLQTGEALWFYKFSGCSVGISGGTRPQLFDGLCTGPVVVLTGDLLTSAIGRRIADGWGLAVGAQLSKLHYYVTTGSSPRPYELYLFPVAAYLAKGIDEDYQAGNPVFSVFARVNVGVAGRGYPPDGSANSLSTGATYERDLWGLRFGFGLELSSTSYDIPDECRGIAYCVDVGVSIKHGGWRVIGQTEEDER